jgi:hypothetical protein
MLDRIWWGSRIGSAAGALLLLLGPVGLGACSSDESEPALDAGTPPDAAEDANDDQPPVLEAIGPQVVTEGQALQLTIAGTDPDGDDLAFSASNLPEGASFDPATRTFSWIPDASQRGSHPGVHFEVSDGTLGDAEDVTIYVISAYVAAFVTPPITDDYVLPDTVLPGELAGNRASLTAARGEFESASLVIRPEDDLLAMTAEVGPLVGDSGSIDAAEINLRIVKCWYQAGVDIWHGPHDPINDPLPRLLTPELLLKDDSLVDVQGTDNYLKLTSGDYLWISEEASNPDGDVVPVADMPVQDAATLQPFDVGAGTNKQLWVTVHVPEGAAPGTYRSAIALSTTAGLATAFVLELEVLPFALEPSPLTYSLYYSGYLSSDMPDGSISSGPKSETQLRAELQDMLDHGVTNPSSYQGFDETLLDRYLTIRNEVGLDQGSLYYLGVGTGSSQDPTELAALQSFVQTVRDFVAGYGFTDLYVYGVDEATADALTAERPAWEAVHAAGAKVFVAGYTAATHPPGNYAVVGDIQDLLVCALAPDPAEAANWHSQQHLIFDYANPQVGPELPGTFRRNYGLLLWQADYDGAMDFAYHWSFANIWNDFDHDTYRDHNFTYPTVDGVVDTLQWEGWREGVDDTRYLGTLLALIAARKADGTHDTSAAEAWVAELKSSDLGTLDLDEVRAQMVAWMVELTP